MAALAVAPAPPEQFQLDIPKPNQQMLKISTKNIPLPADVIYNQHDEFEVRLQCRIEKIVNESPLDEHGNPKYSRVISYATVGSYVGDDFSHTGDPEPEPDPDPSGGEE